MRSEPLDFAAVTAEVVSALEAASVIVLATGAGGSVTARSMSPVNIGLDVYMQTDSRFAKVAQIKENPRVALCLGNMQIEGIAEMLGHPMEQRCERFRTLYSEKHRGSFERYSSLATEIVFVVHPFAITLWKYIEGLPCRERLSVADGTVAREYYE